MLSFIFAVLNILALGAGFRAAYLWMEASKVTIAPHMGAAESGDLAVALGQNIGGIFQAFSASADLNRRAAWATFVALLLQMGPQVMTMGVWAVHAILER